MDNEGRVAVWENIRKLGVKFVRLKMVDSSGICDEVYVPIDRINVNIFNNGVQIYGILFASYIHTASLNPFQRHPVVSIICETLIPHAVPSIMMYSRHKEISKNSIDPVRTSLVKEEQVCEARSVLLAETEVGIEGKDLHGDKEDTTQGPIKASKNQNHQKKSKKQKKEHTSRSDRKKAISSGQQFGVTYPVTDERHGNVASTQVRMHHHIYHPQMQQPTMYHPLNQLQMLQHNLHHHQQQLPMFLGHFNRALPP